MPTRFCTKLQRRECNFLSNRADIRLTPQGTSYRNLYTNIKKKLRTQLTRFRRQRRRRLEGWRGSRRVQHHDEVRREHPHAALATTLPPPLFNLHSYRGLVSSTSRHTSPRTVWPRFSKLFVLHFDFSPHSNRYKKSFVKLWLKLSQNHELYV